MQKTTADCLLPAALVMPAVDSSLIASIYCSQETCRPDAEHDNASFLIPFLNLFGLCCSGLNGTKLSQRG
jgi:hypothetical protein